MSVCIYVGLSVTCICLWASVSRTRALFTGKMFLYVATSISSGGMFVCEEGCVLEGPTESLGSEAEPSL